MEYWQDDACKAEKAWYALPLSERLAVALQVIEEHKSGKAIQKIIPAGSGDRQWVTADVSVHNRNNEFANLNGCFRVKPIITMDARFLADALRDFPDSIPVIEYQGSFGYYYIREVTSREKYIIFHAEDKVKLTDI